MSILFYDHLVNKNDIHEQLNQLDLLEDNKGKFKTMIDEILHAGIIEFVLQKLHPHHHHNFLSQLERAPYDPELLSYLKQYADEKIEDAIEKESQRIVKLIIKDIKSSTK